MARVAIVGAGSLVFTRTLVSDLLQQDATADVEIALIDTDPGRLASAHRMAERMVAEAGKARVVATTDCRAGVRGASYVVNTIQVGGKEATLADFDIPERYGVHQTIADTHGIGGIARAVRTIPHVLEIAQVVEEVAPEAWFLNYTNPMAMIVMALARRTGLRHVGLCHDAENTVTDIASYLNINREALAWHAAGINHMTWFLGISSHGKDLYPDLRALADQPDVYRTDPVRFELLRRFGYFVSESSVHNAEYYPWFLRDGWAAQYPAVRLREYVYRLDDLHAGFEDLQRKLDGPHESAFILPRSREYAPGIIGAIESNTTFSFMGNVSNSPDFIPALPAGCCVEVPSFIDRGALHSAVVSDFPPGCAALSRLAVNVQILAVEGILQKNRDLLYQAAFVDPRLSSILGLADIARLTDDVLEAQEKYLPPSWKPGSRRLFPAG